MTRLQLKTILLRLCWLWSNESVDCREKPSITIHTNSIIQRNMHNLRFSFAEVDFFPYSVRLSSSFPPFIFKLFLSMGAFCVHILDKSAFQLQIPASMPPCCFRFCARETNCAACSLQTVFLVARRLELSVQTSTVLLVPVSTNRVEKKCAACSLNYTPNLMMRMNALAFGSLINWFAAIASSAGPISIWKKSYVRIEFKQNNVICHAIPNIYREVEKTFFIQSALYAISMFMCNTAVHDLNIQIELFFFGLSLRYVEPHAKHIFLQ